MKRSAPIAALWIGLVASSWTNARAQEKPEPAPGDRAVKAGMAAWEKLRQSKKPESMR